MSDTNTLVDFEWLLSDAAQAQLASVTVELDSGRRGATPALIERLRRELPVDRARMLVGQVALRERATKKFSHAAGMYFTPILLEQATSEAIALYKAESFPEGDVLDLCCGIGGDAIGLAAREIGVSNVTVMDRDEVACRLASHNTRMYAAPGCQVNPVVGDVADAPVSEFSAWHIDPDRRPDGRRTTQVASHEPGVEVLEKLLSANGNAAIKLAPATELSPSWCASCEQEWVGEQRECKQQLLRFGLLARAKGKRTATIVDANGRVMGTVSGSLDEPVEFVSNVADYFYEPHAAVRAAGLTGAVAKQRKFCRMGLETSYMTGPKIDADGTLAMFRVVDSMPFDRRKVKQRIRELGLGRLEIKTRGAHLDPSAEQKRLTVRQDGDPGCVFLFAVESKVRAVITTRCAK